MAMNFPDSPSNGDTVTLNGKEYTYEAAKQSWIPILRGSGTILVSDTTPVSPSVSDLWLDSTNSTLYVYYNDGSSSQWVGTSGGNGADGANSDSVMTTYTDITARNAATPSAGEMAWVISNKSLYIWDGNEWDRVYSGTQTAPTWTTAPAAAYNLEGSGVASQVTIAATDPEGFDIDYSVSITPTNQTQATIVNAGNGVFDITPALDDGTNDGTFTARFAAFDGLINLPFYSTFTLASRNFYEVAYIAAYGSGSTINVEYQGSGVHNITSVLQGATNGDSILLSAGTYEVDPYSDGGYNNDPFLGNEISIVGKTSNPAEVVLTVNEGSAREHALFNGSGTNARHFANMRIVRPYTGTLNYSGALTSWSSGGVAQNCIIDLNDDYVSWAYSHSSSSKQGVFKNCSFVNYSGWLTSYGGAASSSNLVLNCAFDSTEVAGGRGRWSYDGSTFTADTASGTGTSITFDSTTYDYTGKTLFGHLKDITATPIVAITKITKEQWYGV